MFNLHFCGNRVDTTSSSPCVRHYITQRKLPKRRWHLLVFPQPTSEKADDPTPWKIPNFRESPLSMKGVFIKSNRVDDHMDTTLNCVFIQPSTHFDNKTHAWVMKEHLTLHMNVDFFMIVWLFGDSIASESRKTILSDSPFSCFFHDASC